MANLTLSEKRKERTQQQAATTSGRLSYTLGDLRAMRDVGIVRKEEQDPQQAAERRDYWLQKTAGTREEMRRQAEDVLLKDQQIFFPPSKTRERNRIGAGETGQAATVVPSDRIAPLGEREITDIPSKEETDALLEDALGFLEAHKDDGKPKENPLTATRPSLFVSQAEPIPVPQSKRVGAGEIATTEEQREAERQARMKELYDSTYSGAARDRIDAQNAQIDKEMEDWWAEVDQTGEEIRKNNPDTIYKSLDLERIRETDPMYRAKVAQGRNNANNKVETTIAQQGAARSVIEGGDYSPTSPNMGRDILGAIFNAADATKASDAGYNQMTTGMRDMYAYLLTEYGPKVADRYLADLSDELRMREAQTRAENIVNPSYKGPMAGLVNNLLPYANAAESGFIAPMMGWTRFLNQIAGDPNHLPGDVRQYTSQIVGNMLGEEDGKVKIFGKNVKQTLHDLVETTASQWPQVIIGGLGGNQVETLLPMVIQVAGNEYDAAVEEGYGQNEARLYALLQAGTEYLTEIIGGVGFVSGGTLTEEMTGELVQKIRPGLLRLAASLGIDAAGEGVEEIISGMMDPFERRLALGDQEANLDWRDIAYQGALGGLSGLVMGGPANVSSYISDIGEKARTEIKNKAADTTVKGFDDAEDKAAIMKEGMLAYGIDEELADKAADAAAKMVNGEKLTLEELQMLGSDTDLSDFVVDVTQKHVEAAKTAGEQTETKEPEKQLKSKPELPTEQQYEEPETEQEIAEAEQTPEKPALPTEKQYEEPESKVPDTTNMSDNRAAYEYGKAGLGVEDFEDLMGRQATAYEKGAMKRGQQQAAKERAIREAQIAHYRRSARPSNRTAGVSYMGSDEAASYNVEAANESAMSEKQKNAAKALELLSKATGMRFVLYESARNARGEHAGRNGWYDMKTQTAYIDVSSGINGEEAMIRTAAHEVTHHIKNWAPEKFNELQDFLIGFYHTQGESSLNALIEEEIEEASAHGRQISREEALEETLANACENMLTDADAVGELAEKHTSLFARIKLHIDSFLAHLRQAIQGVGPSTNAGRMLWESANTMRQAQEIWFDALENASENLRGQINEALDEAVDEISKGSKSTDFILIPGTDFRLVDYRKPQVIRADVQKKARETGIAIRQNGQLVPVEQRTETAPVAQQEVMSAEEAKQALDIVENMAEPLQPVNTRISDMFESAINQEAVNDLVTAATGTKAKKPVSRFSSAAFKKLLEKWSDNEWVNAKTDAAKAAFESFAKKWYNAGRSGESQIQVPFEENDANYPIFLQDTFYRQGVTEKEAADRRAAIKTKKPTRKPKGETENGAEVQVPDQGTVPAAELLWGENVRKLGDVDAETVSGVSGAGTAGPVQLSENEGRGAGRTNGSDDTAGSTGRRGVGDSEGGDIRPVSGVREEVTEENTEPLTVEEGAEEERQQKAEPIQNFVIGDSLDLPSKELARFDANIEAIKTVKRIITENRQATPEEQVILSKYVGWGGLKYAFDENKWPNRYKTLKALLTEDEYNTAFNSTANAHYTSVEVIRAMYEGLRGYGFKGGRMLEPACGTGNFVGAMPADMSHSVSSWRMIELDKVTSDIAKYLYPKAKVENIGFQDAKIPNDFIDVAISNVPFGNIQVADKNYPDFMTKSIHNYFFAKALDKVRPGGLLMFITSHYTLDSNAVNVRNYLSQKANFLGAVRLPYTAFKSNANTEVVTDIIVMQKRENGTPYTGEEFFYTQNKFLDDKWTDSVKVNEYFIKHPDMILGKLAKTGTMYEANAMNVEPVGDNLGEQIQEALGKIKARIKYDRVITTTPNEAAVKATEASTNTKENGYEKRDGNIYRNEGGNLVKIDADSDTAARISGLIDIKEKARELLNAQQLGKTDEEINKLRDKLNDLYNRFVSKYGPINDKKNKKAFGSDPDRHFLSAIEKYNEQTKKAEKTDIFFKNTVVKAERAKYAGSAAEGLLITLNESNSVDIARIAELTGESEEKVEKELLDTQLIFLNEDGALVPRGEYLSGNVRNKLRIARELAEGDERYAANVAELEKVIPKDIAPEEISVKMGATWIPDAVYTQFLHDVLYHSYRVQGNNIRFDKVTGAYIVNAKNSDYSGWGKTETAREFEYGKFTILDMISANLNNKRITIRDSESGKVVQNETAAVRKLQDKLNDYFSEWLWKDDTRKEEMNRLYNDIYNSTVLREYTEDGLTVNGLVAGKTLRKHQAIAVKRAVEQGGNLLLAHKVGAGKTASMAAIAMKLRELGIIKKPVFTVPKSIVEQWGKDFMDFFPAAKLLIADNKSFQKDQRKVFMNQLATGDFDAIIMSHDQLKKLPMSVETQRQFIQEQIDEIIEMEEALSANTSRGRSRKNSVGNLAKKRQNLEAKLKKLNDIERDEDNATFEDLGIDALFVDEAHKFKNLFYATGMNVKGLGDRTGSARSFDLYMKVRYLQQLNGGKGVIFATATPIMNSMVEMYTMQRYLQMDVLKQLNINNFDSWANQFGKVTTTAEMNASGKYTAVQSFNKFTNMPELQRLFRSFADVITDIPGLKIPVMRGGKRIVIESELTPFQEAYKEELGKRSEAYKNGHPGRTRKGAEDNMAVINADARAMAISQKLIDPSLDYGEGCKIYKCCDNVYQEYLDSQDEKGTQLIFCDLSTPKKSDTASAETDSEDDKNAIVNEDPVDEEAAKVYDEIKRTLIAKGVKPSEIAYIHDAKNPEQRIELFRKVREGTVRVLIGSTFKMGEGMNVQDRIVALHHIDCPFRPGDLEQREGRALRQGNRNNEVAIYTYVTNGSFDSTNWSRIRNKASFISQAMNGNLTSRTIEGDELELSAAEIMAICSDNPIVLEQTKVQSEIRELEAEEKTIIEKRKRAREDIANATARKAQFEMRLPDAKADAAKVKDISGDKFKATIAGKTFDSRTDFGKEMIKQAGKYQDATKPRKVIGEIAGLELFVTNDMQQGVHGDAYWTCAMNPLSPQGTTTMLENQIKKISQAPEVLSAAIVEQQNIIDTAGKLVDIKFDKTERLQELRRRDEEISEILKPEDSANAEEEDTTTKASERRTDVRSDRELLENAFEGLAADDTERAELAKYKAQIGALEEKTDLLKDINSQIKDISFGKGKRDMNKLQQLKTRKEALLRTITDADKVLLRMEKSETLRRVLEVEKQKEKTRIQKKADERVGRIRETAVRNAYKQSIEKRLGEMTEYLTRPTTKKYVPETLRAPLLEFVKSVDFSSQRKLKGKNPTKKDIRFAETLKAVNDALERVNSMYSTDSAEGMVESNFGMYLDLPDGFKEELTKLTAAVMQVAASSQDGYTVNNMTSDQLKTFSKLISALSKGVTNMNKMMASTLFQHLDQATTDTINTLKSMRMKNASTKIGKSLEWDNAMPAYAFERFGKGGEAIFQGFKNGQAALAFNTEEILRFTKDCFTEKEAQEWGKDIKTLELENGETLNIPVSYIMSLHCLMKRAQAQGHIFGGGIRVSNYKAGSKLMQDTGHNVTEQDVKNLESMLTERQIWVADQMQNYMAEKGSEWGNYVSLRRFGYRFFEEGPTYFPISSDGDFLPTFNEEGGKGSGEGRNLYALLNISPAKDIVKGANNRIAIYDIFDVFSNHMSDMAQYNAFALPVLDAIKWFNYKEKFNNPGDKSFKPTSIKQSMREAFGDAAVGYVKNLIADVSGAQATGGNENSSGLTMLHRYNRAQVAANLRVAMLQPLSYVRAGMELNIGSMAKALALNPIRLRSNIAEMQELSGIARWKELGFYDNNVSRSVRQLIKGEERTIDKITTKTMTLAEKMDQVTWAAMWEASKQQVARRIGRNSENFYDEVVKLFENTIYKTQVVDSILTKSSFMRNGSTWNKVMSSFMSESVTTYNMIADCIWKLADMSRSDNVTAESKQRLAKKIGRAGIVYAANVIVTTILEALMNAYRDDDDYRTFWEKFKDGIYVDLIDNAAPWNWLPLWSQLWDVVKGGINVITGDDNWYTYGTDNPFTQGAQMLVDYTSKIKQKIEAIEKDGEDAWMSGYTKWGLAYKGMQAVSAISGLPFATGAREAVSLWNATAANADHQLKLQTYNTPVSVGTNALIQAAAGNDSARALQLIQEMQENGYDLDSIQKKTISAAAVAVYNNELDIDTAVRILKEYGGKTKTEAESYLHDYLTKKETDYNSKYGHVYEYISDWNGTELKREIKLLQDQGNENKNIMSGITNQFKKEYIAASKSERATMKQHLIVAYKLLGLSEDAAAKKIDDWLK